MAKYAYSYDREDFTGSFDTEQAAFEAAVRESEGIASPPTTIYIGTIAEGDPQTADHAHTILEAMNRRAHVDYGDSAARYLANVPPKLVDELDAALAATIEQWLKKHNLMPTFVRFGHVREVPVITPPARVSNGGPGQREVHDLGPDGEAGL
jgi:hypothetical protein